MPRLTPSGFSTTTWMLARPRAHPRFEAVPRRRDARVDAQPPASCARPRIASTPSRHVHAAAPVYQVQPPRPTQGGAAVDVAGEHVGLDAVALDGLARCAARSTGLSSRKMRSARVAVAERGVREAEPGRRVRVLAAVLANARRVGADVAGIVRRRRRTAAQSRSTSRSASRTSCSSAERTAVARALAARRAAGEDRPRLRDRVDAALALLRRADQRAVVVEGAQVPRAVPRDALDRVRAAPRRARATPSASAPSAARSRARRSASWSRTGTTPSHTLSPRPSGADPVHAVVPVAVAHERAARAGPRSARARSARAAVLEQRAPAAPSARTARSDRARLRRSGVAGRGTAPARRGSPTSPVAAT